jgi:hypothetical protein
MSVQEKSLLDTVRLWSLRPCCQSLFEIGKFPLIPFAEPRVVLCVAM